MKQISKDPFEAAFEEQEDSPPESPTSAADADAFRAALDEDYDEGLPPLAPEDPSSSSTPLPPLPSSTITTTVATVTPTLKKKTTTTTKTARPTLKPNKDKDDDEDEDEDNVDVELGKYSSATGDPVQKAQMQAMLTRFSPQQMSRYESFRRAGFQKSNMKRLLASISGSAKVSVPMTIVVSGIAKMFVGELVETSRMVMTERRESGPIRPCHLREAYRRLKLEGKVPKRSVSRLFR